MEISQKFKLSFDLQQLKLPDGCSAKAAPCDPSLGVTPLSTAPWLQCSMWSTAGALQRCSINGPRSPGPAVAPRTPGHQHEGGALSQHSQHDLCRPVQAMIDEASSLHLHIHTFLSKKAAAIILKRRVPHIKSLSMTRQICLKKCIPFFSTAAVHC